MTKLFIFLGVFALVACSGGSSGRRLNYDMYCKQNYDPLPMRIDKARKLELNSDNLPVGHFVLSGADFFVTDTSLGKERSVKIHVREELNSKGGYTSSGVCSRGLEPGQTYEHETAGISEMTKDEAGKLTIKTRNYYFRIHPKGFLREFEPKDEFTNEPPSKVYDGKSAAITEYALFKKSEKEYEIRVIDRFSDGVSYYLATRLIKK